jgi:hypothetical protein
MQPQQTVSNCQSTVKLNEETTDKNRIPENILEKLSQAAITLD